MKLKTPHSVWVALSLTLILGDGAALAQAIAPALVASSGYLNGTPLTSHTSASFNSSGATSFVAFVSTHPSWNGQPVSLGGLTDSMGNTWNVLTGPIQWPGSAYTLLSAIYYVNAPVTSAAHTVTVNLTNPAPLVFHVFAVSGSNITRPPTFAPITGPDGTASADVVSAPVSVPANTLLLGWAKNETDAVAAAVDGWVLDSQSTSFLWAESQTVAGAGSYTGHFQYSSAIGWQTAVVALQSSNTPVAFDQTVMTDPDTPLDITLNASSPLGFQLTYSVVAGPAQGTLTGAPPYLTYTPNAGYTGSDSFRFKANDTTADSNIATIHITVSRPGPSILATRGYMNGNPQTIHTTAPFNSGGASALVAFVSTYPSWNGQPVSITGVNDSAANVWTLLTGPTTWSGSSFTQISAIYYVNAPLTSATHTVSVQLTNGAPLVAHVFVVSNSDTTTPPISSAITDPGPGGFSANVTSAPISVPATTLLLGWVKNEIDATATALGGYALDPQSTSFLWAESQTALTSGSYTNDFRYSAAIGWQTAVVGMKPSSQAPVASDGSVVTGENTAVSGTLLATSAGGKALTVTIVSNGTMGTAVITNAATGTYTYTPNPNVSGTDSFTFKANDGQHDSNVATISITITPTTTPPPTPVITATPANPTSQTSVSFGFGDTQIGVSFLCQLDGSLFTACVSPKAYSGLNQGSHTFAVEAQDAAGNQGTPASFTWSIITTPPPPPTITSTPPNPTNQTSASFGFSDTQASVSFVCQLDGNTLSPCSSPTTYSGVSQGGHTFSVAAKDSAGNQSAPSIFGWTIDTTPPPLPTITAMPANPTNQTSAPFSFTDTEAGVRFLCQIDGSAFNTCSSPVIYSSLSQASHTFSVRVQDTAGNQSGASSFTWTVDTTAPPKPVITSAPVSPTSQTSATFSFTDTEAGVKFFCQLDASAFGACSSPVSYSGLRQASHTFSVRAQDTAGNLSGPAKFTWTIDMTIPPTPTITSSPANPANQTSASFSFSDAEKGVGFVCQLDNLAFSACTSPKTYSSLSAGNHTFSVLAQDASGNQSAAASVGWTIDTTPPPVPSITSRPANPTNQTSASFSFVDTEAGVNFLCQLDGGRYSACSSPMTYSGLKRTSHSFSVKAQDAAGNQSGAASFTWTITP